MVCTSQVLAAQVQVLGYSTKVQTQLGLRFVPFPVQAAQTPASTTSKQGLGKEAQAALLRVRTGPECPMGNLRKLT